MFSHLLAPNSCRQSCFILVLIVPALILMGMGREFSLSSPADEGHNSHELKGSVSKADRLPSWLRERAIDKLPLYSASNGANKSSHQDEKSNDSFMNEAQLWAEHTSHQNWNDRTNRKNTTSNNTESNEIHRLIIDAIIIGSEERIEYLQTQKDTWASREHKVRNVFAAFETNVDDILLQQPNNGEVSVSKTHERDAGGCSKLEKSCFSRHATDGVERRRFRRLDADAKTGLGDGGNGIMNGKSNNTTDTKISNSKDFVSEYQDVDDGPSTHSSQNSTINSSVNSGLQEPSKQQTTLKQFEHMLQQKQHNQENKEKVDMCLQRRIGLAMGVSGIRYQKMIHALSVESDQPNPDYNSGAESNWFRNANVVLPNYLIVTFDSTYFNAEILEECIGFSSPDHFLSTERSSVPTLRNFDNHEKGTRSKNNAQEIQSDHSENEESNNHIPVVYSPSIKFANFSSIQNNLEKVEDREAAVKSNVWNDYFFSYPSGKAGVLFNKAALARWIRPISCYVSSDGRASYSFSNTTSIVPIDHDPAKNAVDHLFCQFLSGYYTDKTDAVFANRIDAFLLQSFRVYTTTKQPIIYSHKIKRDKKDSSLSILPMSISDLFLIFSATMHLTCGTNSDGIILGGGEMLGYLVQRFQISVVSNELTLNKSRIHPVGFNPTMNSITDKSCTVMLSPANSSHSSNCNPNNMLFCSDLSLEQMRALERQHH